MNQGKSLRVLAVDAGNTRVKWGLHDGREWFMRGRFATAAAGSAEAFSHLPHNPDVDCIVVSNVAGAQVANAIKDALYSLGKPVTFIEAANEQCGVTNRYEPANILGTDRWAALIGARAVSQSRAQLVVMAGTALTIDTLSSQGVFLGGIIIPGISLMRASLHQGTAQLPDETGEYQTFPRNTLNAITSGAIEACSGAIQRMYTHLSANTGDVPQCIAGGGSIHVIAPHLPFPVTINDNLVLDGLIAIATSAPDIFPA
ncbi:MAG: type III pantothenate kinase [Betaproteobacteria bacterium]